jgi:transposase-like protein
LANLKSENIRLNKALKHAEEERDILKKAATYFAKLAE